MEGDVKKFIKAVEKESYSIGKLDVFRDFAEYFAISIRNSFLKNPELDKESSRIINSQKAYKTLLPELAAIAIDGMEARHCDFLGEVFMSLDLGNSAKGQFFTPYNVSLLTAKMQISKPPKDLILETIDPCCGAGSMILAIAQVLKEINVNPAVSMFAVGQDIDRTACNMCYIQMSLYAIPGIVIWGDSLSLESREQWFTPMWFTKEFQERYKWHKTIKAMNNIMNSQTTSEGAKENEKQDDIEKLITSVSTMLPEEQMVFDFN